jgi:putative transposase
MKQLKAFKYRIYPTPDQEIFLSKTFGCVRFVWNQMVANFNSFSKDGPNRPMNEKILKDNPEHIWLNEVSSAALQQKRIDFDATKTQFFNKKRAVKLGHMKFKSRDNGNQSFRLPASITAIDSFTDIENGTIKLPKMLPMKIVAHRSFTGETRNLTISKNASNQYFVSILVEEDIGLKPMAGKEVGIDLGLTDLAILSNGIKFQRPKQLLEKTNQKLKKAQKKLAKMKKGSIRYKVQKLKVAACYAKVTRVRNDYYHCISSWLVDNYDAIYMENLNVKGMVKNRCLSRAIAEASWATLVGMIAYKATWYGKTFHKIDRFFASSKTCSSCGTKSSFGLSVREWTCSSCGTVHDRDLNAAINIKNRGQLDCYEKLIPDATIGRDVNVPLGLEKRIVKIYRSNISLVNSGTKPSSVL